VPLEQRESVDRAEHERRGARERRATIADDASVVTLAHRLAEDRVRGSMMWCSIDESSPEARRS
jgi:hypothetical protein